MGYVCPPVANCFKGVPIYQTSGVMQLAKESLDKWREIDTALKQFLYLDWGDTTADDAAMNNENLRRFDEIIAEYSIADEGSIYIIADGNSNSTGYAAITLLLPGEY